MASRKSRIVTQLRFAPRKLDTYRLRTAILSSERNFSRYCSLVRVDGARRRTQLHKFDSDINKISSLDLESLLKGVKKKEQEEVVLKGSDYRSLNSKEQKALFDLCDQQAKEAESQEEMQQNIKLLANLFASLSPNELEKWFGIDVLLWTFLNIHSSFERDKIGAYLVKHGFDPIIHNIIIEIGLASLDSISMWGNGHFYKPGEIPVNDLKQFYSFAVNLQRVLDQIDLRRIIEPNLNAPADPSNYELRAFFVGSFNLYKTHDYEKTWGQKQMPNGLFSRIYLDCPIGFGLFFKGVPNGVASFTLQENGNLLSVRQIQQVFLKQQDKSGGWVRFSDPQSKPGRRKASPKGLFNLDWKKTLFEICEKIAKIARIPRVRVQSGEHNMWVHQRKGEEKHLRLGRAITIYDATASRIGYDMIFLNPEHTNWAWERKII